MGEKFVKFESIEKRERTEQERTNIAGKFHLPEETSWEEIEAYVGDERWIEMLRAALLSRHSTKAWKEYTEMRQKYNLGKDSFDCSEGVEKIESILLKYEEQSELLDELHTISSQQEAEGSELRKVAIVDRNRAFSRLDFLADFTNLEKEKYDELYAKWKKLSLAIGVISGGIVDHTR